MDNNCPCKVIHLFLNRRRINEENAKITQFSIPFIFDMLFNASFNFIFATNYAMEYYL